MKRILDQILRDSNFEVEPLPLDPNLDGNSESNVSEPLRGLDPALFGAYSGAGIDNYCLVVFVDSIPDHFLANTIPSYVTTLRNYLADRFLAAMPKNFSLIVCWKREPSSPAEVEPLILQIEEDPFDFKKYVLVYRQAEADTLHQRWQQSSLPILQFLNKYLYQDERFDLFKQQTAPVPYELAVRLFTKIPFLRIPVKEKLYDDLGAVIQNKLEKRLTTLRDTWLSQTEDEFMHALQEPEEPEK